MELMKPMTPMEPMKPMQPMEQASAWWPEDLGQPASRGGQHQIQYAFFPDRHRLLIEQDGAVTTYDSGDHQISGVAQQSGSRIPTFTSQSGTVSLDDLKRL